MRIPRARLGAVAVLAAAGLLSASAAAATLAPHEALYSMSRKSATIESDVVGVKGSMQIRVEASCDGWRVEQYLGFRVMSADEAVLEHLARLSGFETADGREYWFSTRTYEDREIAEELSGVARLERPGGSGTVRFVKPSEIVRPLPEGTLFPTRHIEALVEAAASGARQMSRIVFDGSTLESPHEIAAAIGARRRGGVPGFPALDGAARWPMRLAYYPVAALGPAPDFQMSVLLFENGVAGDMIYDYGEFTVAVKLEALEMLPRPECG